MSKVVYNNSMMEYAKMLYIPGKNINAFNSKLCAIQNKFSDNVWSEAKINGVGIPKRQGTRL